MNTYADDPSRFENRAIAAHSEMILERIEQGYNPSLLTFTSKPTPSNRALPPEVIGTRLGQFYSLVLTRLIHHPRRGSVGRLPFMVAMPDLPVFKHQKAAAVAKINDGLHAHAIFLTPVFTRQRYSLITVLEKYGDVIMDICHLTSIHQSDIAQTPSKASAYVLKSLDLKRFDSDHVWIFPKSKSELTNIRGAGRLGS